MSPVTLHDIVPLSLLDRLDTKFVVHEDQLCEAVAATIPHFQVLEVNGCRVGRYVTTYFDTLDFDMYRSHHNGIRARFKLRCRDYIDSQMTFVEVKMKSNKERMVKFRHRVAAPITATEQIDPTWLPPGFPYDLASVKPVVWNRFRRVTLVNFVEQERITFDTDIEFGCGEHTIAYQGLTIVEIKQPKFSFNSPFVQQLHRMHINPTGISKFCIAAVNFYPNFKHNQFKPLLMQLNKKFPMRGRSERSD